MARGRRSFRPSDVTAAMRAVEKAGKSVARVRIGPDGVVEVITGAPAEADLDTGGFDHDEALERFRDARKNVGRRQKRSAPVEP